MKERKKNLRCKSFTTDNKFWTAKNNSVWKWWLIVGIVIWSINGTCYEVFIDKVSSGNKDSKVNMENMSSNFKR
jgi:hypothetical protein